MRARRVDRRAAFRRLPPYLRAAAILDTIDTSPTIPAWLWPELIELVTSSTPSPGHPVERFMYRFGLLQPRLPVDRSMLFSRVAQHWKSLESQEQAVALVIGSDTLPTLSVDLASVAHSPAFESLLDLAAALGEPALTRITCRVALRPESGAELGDARFSAMVVSLVRASAASFGTVHSESLPILEGLAWALQKVRTVPEMKVRRGVAWGTWALLELTQGQSEARRTVVEHALESDTPVGRAMVGVLRWDRDPLIRRAAWRWAPLPGLAAAAIDRLARTSSPREHEELLRLGHLAARPARALRLRIIRIAIDPVSRIVAPGGFLPTLEQVAQLSADARRHLPRLVLASDADAHARSAAIDPLLTDDDELVRINVAARAGSSEVRDLCFDTSLRVARIAANRWSRTGIDSARRRSPPPEIARVLDALRASPHAPVRAIARQDHRGMKAFDANDPVSRLRARQRMATDRNSFLTEVRTRLTGPDHEAAVAALRLLDAIGAAEAMESDLIQLVSRHATASEGSGPSRVLAAAVRCLSMLTSAAAARALDTLVNAADARVRANSIDALVLRAGSPATAGTLVARLVELKDDPAHRVRGAVARGLALMSSRGMIAPADAILTVRAMIEDARSAHRAAGAWAASRSAHALPDRAFRAWLRDRALEHATEGDEAGDTPGGHAWAALARLNAEAIGGAA